MSDGDELRKFDRTPRTLKELIDWLKENPGTDRWREDDWRERCREDFPTASSALIALSQKSVWPAERWRVALQVWSEDALQELSWNGIGRVLRSAPDDLWHELAHGIGWWLHAIAPVFDGNESVFLEACRRLLAQDHDERLNDDDPIGQAINHAIGLTTEALLRWWYRKPLEDGQELPTHLSAAFSGLCDPTIDKFRHARVILARNLISLFRVDPKWTRDRLLPLFDWEQSEDEALVVWKGFLWSPRMHRPLLETMKHVFLQTAERITHLGQYAESYVALLTFLAINPGDQFSRAELIAATNALPPDGLCRAVKTLVHALESAGENRGDYWTTRIAPFLHNIWPKSREILTPALSESLALLCIAAGDAFPRALSTLGSSLQPLQQAHYVVYRLNESALCRKYPTEALELLNLIIDTTVKWPPSELRNCLEAISSVKPKLTSTPSYKRLAEYLRQRGDR